mgnify:CR=1 FL=1
MKYKPLCLYKYTKKEKESMHANSTKKMIEHNDDMNFQLGMNKF